MHTKDIFQQTMLSCGYVIDKIIVYGKDRLEIQFKYADEIQEMTEVAQNIREIEEKEGRFKCGA